MKKGLFILLTIIVAEAQGNAQSLLTLKFNYYTTANGLGSTNVRKTIQDPKGFIWVATQDGLYRFDGNRFIAYNKSAPGRHALTGVDIRDLCIRENTLWSVNSYGGIDAIDISSGQVIYKYDQQKDNSLKDVLFVSAVVKGDSLYLGSDKGLYVLNTKTKQLSRPGLNHADGKASLNICKVIAADANHLWLLCASQGVKLFSLQDFTIQASYTDESVFFYDADLTDQGLITATNAGIRVFRFENKAIKEVFDLKSLLAPFQNEPIFAIRKDNDGNIWFSDKNHLAKLTMQSGRIQYVNPGKFFNGKDWTSSAFGISFDKMNNLWLSCQEGLAFSANKPAEFICFNKSALSQTIINHCYYLFPYDDSSVLACAEDGLYRVNQATKSIDAIDRGKAYFFAFESFDKKLIVSNEEGTYVSEGNVFISLHKRYPEFNGFGVVMFNSMTLLNDSACLLGSQNNKGIYIWNYQSKKVTNITQHTEGMALKDNDINRVYKDPSGAVWILAANSASLYSANENKISELVIQNPATQKKYTIFFDVQRMKGLIYLASYGNGIIVLDEQYRFKRELSDRNGLANNGVYKLLPYKDSLLLATTNNGLSVINPATGEIKNFYSSDGLHSNVFEELSGNMRNNVIYAGGSDGFTVIRPDLLSANTSPPYVSINNVRIETEQNKIDTTNYDLQKVVIPNNVKQVIIYFSGLNYFNPARTNFSYKITELHKDWINQGNQNFVTLIGLNPGTYHLRVQAFNEDGVASEIKELILIFRPKWYQTWWFKLSLALIFVASVYALYRFRINQLKKEQEIRSKLASDLHDDLGSTLNSVKVYANLALMESDRDKYLGKVKESIQEGITGVRDMIWVLDDSKDTTEHLLSRISQFAAPLCEANGIRYNQQIGDEAREHKLARAEKRNLYMILKEAVNNACKYSGAKELVLEISLHKKRPVIDIKDNGKGFDSAVAGEGNGLKNIKQRARQIRYAVNITSSPGNGTHIHLQKI